MPKDPSYLAHEVADAKIQEILAALVRTAKDVLEPDNADDPEDPNAIFYREAEQVLLAHDRYMGDAPMVGGAGERRRFSLEWRTGEDEAIEGGDGRIAIDDVGAWIAEWGMAMPEVEQVNALEVGEFMLVGGGAAGLARLYREADALVESPCPVAEELADSLLDADEQALKHEGAHAGAPCPAHVNRSRQDDEPDPDRAYDEARDLRAERRS